MSTVNARVDCVLAEPEQNPFMLGMLVYGATASHFIGTVESCSACQFGRYHWAALSTGECIYAVDVGKIYRLKLPVTPFIVGQRLYRTLNGRAFTFAGVVATVTPSYTSGAFLAQTSSGSVITSSELTNGNYRIGRL